MSDKINRRDFLQKSAMAGAGFAAAPTTAAFSAAASLKKAGDPLRVGIIGSGLRGQSHIDLLLQSIAAGSQPMPFPDFTRGRWMKD